MQSRAMVTVRVRLGALCARPPVPPPAGPLVCSSLPRPSSVHPPPLRRTTHLVCAETLLSAATCRAECRDMGAESEGPSCSGHFRSPGEPDMFPGCSETRPAGMSPSLALWPPQAKEREEQACDSAGRTALSESGTARPRVPPIPSALPSTSGLGALCPSCTAEPHGKIWL